ncbi:MAG: MATE family efflux transporter [Lachnospiraceae bacterium]|nr:MATE family efflux transporter [Lachnospiraceae bacterium]
MKKRINLLEGPILGSLTKLALPIMATSLIQMAYNMIDMIWIGRISSGAVAAVGAAGMYSWLANGLVMIPKTGGQIKVGHSLGAKNEKDSVAYATHTFQSGILLGLIYGLIMILFAKPLIGFFKLNSEQVIADATVYLMIVCGLVIFTFLNQIFTGIFTAMGNSHTPFFANAVGLIINIILDPLLIFGFGPMKAMGVAGAAVATVFAQFVVTTVFIFAAFKDTALLRKVRLLKKPEMHYIKDIVALGLPAGIQSMIFTSISMFISRFIAGYGDDAVAVQKVGSQIESISWMTAEGFAAAVNSFVAQNHGARQEARVRKGYRAAMSIVMVWGIFCTFLLIVFPKPIFQIFIPDASVVPMGVSYLVILGFSQLFMCIEITTSGAFQGLGRTLPPSLTGIILTGARIPMLLVLSKTALGLDGIWWSISISSILKGIVLFSWFLLFLRGYGKERAKQ